MTEQAVPFFVAGVRIGSVMNAIENRGIGRGTLVLDSTDADASAIIAVVSLAKKVDDAVPEDYLAAWQTWRDGCDEIQDLGLWIGSKEGPVRVSPLSHDWSIEWQNMLPDDFFLESMNGRGALTSNKTSPLRRLR